MTELMNTSDKVTISSREIAELTGKEHRNVLRDIDKLNETYVKIPLPKVEQGGYTLPETGPQEHRMYLLTKMQTMDLMTGYNLELRIKVNRRWEELEKGDRKVWTLEESLKHQLVLIEENKALSAIIEENHAKVVFADAVAGSDNSILTRQFAKVLSDEGFEIGQNRLFRWFRENGYLNRDNEPYQNYVQQGLFEVIERTVGASDQTFTTRTTKITGKGQTYFAKKLRDE